MIRRQLLFSGFIRAVLKVYTSGTVSQTPIRSVTIMSGSSLACNRDVSLTIGDVTVPVPANVSHPERVTWVLPGDTTNSGAFHIGEDAADELSLDVGDMFFHLGDNATRQYLRWICQKELLKQDMCLTGEPGPALRWLVLLYSRLTRREVQCVSLNRDTNEGDLGQRREIRNGTLSYEDQSVVIAAREGQLLLLEGLERVERNVLPVINNLLENREMHLENGMVLIHPERYDKIFNEALCEELKGGRQDANVEGGIGNQIPQAVHAKLQRMGFIRVSESFRVIGITAPVPPYDGTPLDPPLRSRFQCLYVDLPPPTLAATNVTNMAPGGRARGVFESLLKLRASIEEMNARTRGFTSGGTQGRDSAVGGCVSSLCGLQTIGSYEVAQVFRQFMLFPDVPVSELLLRSFPWTLYAQQTGSGSGTYEESMRRLRDYERVLAACDIGTPLSNHICHHSDVSVRDSGKPTDHCTHEDCAVRSSKHYNDVVFIDNVRVAKSKVLAVLQHPVVVGDACVDGMKGKYQLPLYLGEFALKSSRGGPSSPSSGRKWRTVDVKVYCSSSSTVFTPGHVHVLQSMLQLHIAGRHILLLGSSGSGKTTLLHEFARLLGYQTETMYLYADMTIKDLFQRRATDSVSGDTVWQNSALVDAALNGRMAVLDGIDKMPLGMLSSLQQLLIDGSTSLCDGSVLKSFKEYGIIKEKLRATEEEMKARRIFPIHPSFRVVGTARFPALNSNGTGNKVWQNQWRVTHDVTELFGVVQMPSCSQSLFRAILLRVAELELQFCGNEKVDGIRASVGPEGGISSGLKRDVDTLLRLRDELERLQVTEPKTPQLSLRQLLNLTRFRVRYPDDFNISVESTLLLPLLSSLVAEKVRQVMQICGFTCTSGLAERKQDPLRSSSVSKSSMGETLNCHSLKEFLLPCDPTIPNAGAGKAEGIEVSRVFGLGDKPILRINRNYGAKEKAMVPHVPHFHPNPVHESVIVWLAKQYAVGNNILLIGNQGVGKNKVVDAFLARVGTPREYIQLHRDTTVGSLTINPTVENGRVVWADSPLVRAVQQGHCLVVDEIDKAPVEVVQVLKGLIEDHEMRLRDGRQILGPRAHVVRFSISSSDYGSSEQKNIINMHPDFRVIVLANPPGFPFHGNDFYRECGDLFAPSVMLNADAHSQLQVLRAYGVNIPDALLMSLIECFQRLQTDFEEGNITYPFSLRELIAVVRHMSMFPGDGVYAALNNIFNFDVFDENTLRLVRNVLRLHLDPLVQFGGMQKLLPLRTSRAVPLRPSPSLIHMSAKSPAFLPLKLGEVVMSLPVRRLTDLECGGAINWKSAPVWCESYNATDFAADVSANGGLVGFSEWTTATRLPFLQQGDRVIRVAVEAPECVVGESKSVAVLFTRQHVLREEMNGSSSPLATTEIFLAIASLPSVASIAATAVGRKRLAAGQVQLLNLTDLLPLNSLPSSSLRFLGTEASGILASQALKESSHGAFGTSPSFVEVACASSGSILLADASALGLCSTSTALPRGQVRGQGDAAGDKLLGSVLVVHLMPPSSDVALTRHTVCPGCNLVAMTRPREPELYVWSNGHRVGVTLPAEDIRGIHFFANNYASVHLSKSESTFCGVMKLSLMSDGVATASLCLLPNEINGVVVGLTGTKEPTPTEAAMGPVTPEELQGAIIVAGAGSDSEKEGVLYTMVESYSSRSQSWSMRTFANPSISPAVCSDLNHHGTIGIDRVHKQLVVASGSDGVDTCGSLFAVDYHHHTVRHFAPTPTTSSRSSSVKPSYPCFSLDEVAGNILRYDEVNRQLLIGDLVAERVECRHRQLSALLQGSVKQVGAAAATPQGKLSMSYCTSRYAASNNLKHGREDNEEHHGGNTYAGGTGGTDTAGLGGLVGPYRLDKGWPVHQVSPEAKQQVPQHIIEEARRMGRVALQERLREIGMTSTEYERYGALQGRVRAPVAILRSMLSGLKAAEGERVWLRGQTDGVWDDSKIVEGIVGERNIYKRRADYADASPFQLKRKKRLLFVLDVSASMYRFEGMDQRLTKLLESTVMVMEAFTGYEEKIDYAMVGHNGDSACIELVPFGKPPTNQKERAEVCQRMVAHAQYCWSGDNTVQAMRQSIELVTAEKGEAYLVFVISDANLSRYGIEPGELGEIMESNQEVQMFCIFIATLGEQALNLREKLPSGHGFECMDTQALPHILKQIFLSVNLL
ncbi:AAA domain (dynein-related subfamily)/von Willebrand factor type A domain containing protein, putative [Trypanosoma equiperdum]|nr:AAA domain (dynein-related subfamily)/von Willebrand factor type A domain containing protein, putative [Trypanosoma equiperdum]